MLTLPHSQPSWAGGCIFTQQLGSELTDPLFFSPALPQFVRPDEKRGVTLTAQNHKEEVGPINRNQTALNFRAGLSLLCVST